MNTESTVTDPYQSEKSFLRAGIIIGVGSIIGFGIAKALKINPIIPMAISCVAIFGGHLLLKPHSLLSK